MFSKIGSTFLPENIERQDNDEFDDYRSIFRYYYEWLARNDYYIQKPPSIPVFDFSNNKPSEECKFALYPDGILANNPATKNNAKYVLVLAFSSDVETWNERSNLFNFIQNYIGAIDLCKKSNRSYDGIVVHLLPKKPILKSRDLNPKRIPKTRPNIESDELRRFLASNLSELNVEDNKRILEWISKPVKLIKEFKITRTENSKALSEINNYYEKILYKNVGMLTKALSVSDKFNDLKLKKEKFGLVEEVSQFSINQSACYAKGSLCPFASQCGMIDVQSALVESGVLTVR